MNDQIDPTDWKTIPFYYLPEDIRRKFVEKLLLDVQKGGARSFACALGMDDDYLKNVGRHKNDQNFAEDIVAYHEHDGKTTWGGWHRLAVEFNRRDILTDIFNETDMNAVLKCYLDNTPRGRGEDVQRFPVEDPDPLPLREVDPRRAQVVPQQDHCVPDKEHQHNTGQVTVTAETVNIIVHSPGVNFTSGGQSQVMFRENSGDVYQNGWCESHSDASGRTAEDMCADCQMRQYKRSISSTEDVRKKFAPDNSSPMDVDERVCSDCKEEVYDSLDNNGHIDVLYSRSRESATEMDTGAMSYEGSSGTQKMPVWGYSGTAENEGPLPKISSFLQNRCAPMDMNDQVHVVPGPQQDCHVEGMSIGPPRGRGGDVEKGGNTKRPPGRMALGNEPNRLTCTCTHGNVKPELNRHVCGTTKPEHVSLPLANTRPLLASHSHPPSLPCPKTSQVPSGHGPHRPIRSQSMVDQPLHKVSSPSPMRPASEELGQGIAPKLGEQAASSKSEPANMQYPVLRRGRLLLLCHAGNVSDAVILAEFLHKKYPVGIKIGYWDIKQATSEQLHQGIVGDVNRSDWCAIYMDKKYLSVIQKYEKSKSYEPVAKNENYNLRFVYKLLKEAYLANPNVPKKLLVFMCPGIKVDNLPTWLRMASLHFTLQKDRNLQPRDQQTLGRNILSSKNGSACFQDCEPASSGANEQRKRKARFRGFLSKYLNIKRRRRP